MHRCADPDKMDYVWKTAIRNQKLKHQIFVFIRNLQIIVRPWFTICAVITAAGFIAVEPHPVDISVRAVAWRLPVGTGYWSPQVSSLIAALTGAEICRLI